MAAWQENITPHRLEGRYPGMYLAGVYNRVASEAAGEVLAEEHMVNAPNCLPGGLRLSPGQRWSAGGMIVLCERHTQNLQRAVLERRLLLEAADERRLEVVTLLGWSGVLKVRSGVNACVRNRTIEYYLTRTAHGSTLSRVAHASVLAAVDADRAWDSLREALDADLEDTQHGTPRAGIHLGAMAGSIDVIHRLPPQAQGSAAS